MKICEKKLYPTPPHHLDPPRVQPHPGRACGRHVCRRPRVLPVAPLRRPPVRSVCAGRARTRARARSCVQSNKKIWRQTARRQSARRVARGAAV